MVYTKNRIQKPRTYVFGIHNFNMHRYPNGTTGSTTAMTKAGIGTISQTLNQLAKMARELEEAAAREARAD